MALTDQLISYWKLDESSGNAADSVGSNTLTNVGTATYGAGKINNGVDLEDSSVQYLTILDASQSGLDITGDFSVSMWIKLESQPATDASFSLIDKRKVLTNGQYTVLYQNPNVAGKEIINVIWRDSSDNQTSFVNPDDLGLSTGTFYHIVVTATVATPTAAMYLNGASQTFNSAGTSATSIGDNDGAFFLGAAIGGAVPFDGMIDEVGIWSRVLTSGEVTELYNAGAGNQYPFGGGASANHWLLMGV